MKLVFWLLSILVIATISFLAGRVTSPEMGNNAQISGRMTGKNTYDGESFSDLQRDGGPLQTTTLPDSFSVDSETLVALEAVGEAYNWQNVSQLQDSIRRGYQIDPDETRKLVTGLKPVGIFLEAYKELGRLEAADPDEAIRVSDEIEDTKALQSYYLGLISGLAASDPSYAIQVLQSNRETFADVGSVDSIVSQATLAGNPRMAMLAVRKHVSHDEHPRYFYQIYSNWASLNVNEALADLEKRGGSRALSVGATGLFDRWARMDREGFRKWLEANQEHRFVEQAGRTYTKIYGSE